MSVLITGMELPEDKEIFLRIDEKGEVYIYGRYPTELHKAIQIPPHGRLIDADALSEKMVECSKRIPKNSFEWDLCGEVITQVALAPTIIETEEGE